MSFFTGLHGSVATILLCMLLFIDETGVPMPFAPNEVLLIFAGLLIASGAVPVFIFLPGAIVAMSLGSFCGYSWAHRVGANHLRGLAGKLKAQAAFDRAAHRMQHASTWQVVITRLIPGIRPYATLTAGASGMPLRKFMTGSVTAIVIWAIVMTGLGFVVGIPAAHFLSAIQKLALSGGLYVVLGIVGYRATTRAPRDREHPLQGPFVGIARRDRYWLAFLVDAGVIATIVAGFDRITRFIGLHLRVPFAPEGSVWDGLTIVASLALCYIIASRRSSTGETAGERLFDVSYVHHYRRQARDEGVH